MKVLHVWNTAGVASIVAKYMDKMFNTESLVVTRRTFDPYGVTTYGQLWDHGAKVFALRSMLKARRFDVIHVHSAHKLVPYLKLLYGDKLVILHYHGEDIRDKWPQSQQYWTKADFIICATRGLFDSETPSRAVLVPNPADTELFHPGKERPSPKTALHISCNADDLAGECAKEYDLELTIHDRNRQGVIPHLRLPEVLRRYEYYIDVKRNNAGKLLKGSMSKTGLEALACGLKVITWDRKEAEGLPAENRPENVATRVYDLYKEALSGVDRSLAGL